ncbi:MAG: prepilin-type N-terminal cleavage/methylation domain-containing protein [Pontiella sp.]
MKIPMLGKSYKRGFTLIEIMLALLVVTIGIVAITGLLGTSLDSSAKSHDDLNIVSFSDMVLNYYHASTNWSEVPPDGSWTVKDYEENPLDLTSGQFTSGIGKNGHTVSFQLTAANQDSNVKELTLKVWPGYNTNGTSRTFYTEIYNWANQ